MSAAAHTRSNGDISDGVKESIPACQSCRRKKAKCDREQPCAQCVRFDVPCIYDHNGRLKPGLRAGAVEQLQRRVETLENMFLGQSLLWQQLWNSVTGNSQNEDGHPIASQTQQAKDTLLKLARNPSKADDHSHNSSDGPSLKRPRLDQSLNPPLQLPCAEILDEMVEFYFANIHHWIPMLHVRRFRQQIRDASSPIIQAIVAVCLRFTSNPAAGDDKSKRQMSRAYCQQVILNSMESFSVENLQALAIIAFDVIASGRGPSTWSIVGSITRTVEQLQLSVEEPGSDRDAGVGELLIQRMAFLAPSTSWWEAEQRRRVFWTIFLMDRFCSVSTGWNLGLTRADVQRRLPCEGALWESECEVQTPFFGIVDKTSLNSSFMKEPATSGNDEQDAIGGFAYCIEATESLSLVVHFFLHHPLNLSDATKARMWTMRFKELDLRLVQWKLQLPPKWRDAAVLNDDGVMDPNLTLAHLTHNTAVILLHQSIAYPPAHWTDGYPGRLQSAVSAETCIEAATEMVTIGHQFLEHSTMIISSQFSFCMFIAGRMLLTHARCRQVAVLDSLDMVISNLREISHRWSGAQNDDGADDLAMLFAKRLAQARNNQQARFDIRQTVYSEKSNPDETPPENDQLFIQHDPSPASHDPYSLAFPPLPAGMQRPFIFEGLDTFGAPLSMAKPIDQMLDYSFLASSSDYIPLTPDHRVSRYGTSALTRSYPEPEHSNSDTANGLL